MGLDDDVQMREVERWWHLSLPRLAASSGLRFGKTAEGVDLLAGAVVIRRDEDEARRSLADGDQSLLADLNAVRAAVFESDNRTWRTHRHTHTNIPANTNTVENTETQHT